MAISSGSARVPVSTNVTRGASERRIEPGRMSVKAKTPNPFPSDSCTVIRVSSVSGYRRGGGCKSAGGGAGLGGAFGGLLGWLDGDVFRAIDADIASGKGAIMYSDVCSNAG